MNINKKISFLYSAIFLFITSISTSLSAQDEASSASAQPGILESFIIPFALVGVILYFFMIRPQQKRYKQHQSMLTELAKGERVVTSGGVVGTVVKNQSKSDLVSVELADGVVVQVLRSTIAQKYQPIANTANDN